jgi:tetratricopeptide (TPR) repeat protein
MDSLKLESCDKEKLNIFATKAQADAFLKSQHHRKAKALYLAALEALRDEIVTKKDESTADVYLNLQEQRAGLYASLGMVYEATDKLKEAEVFFNKSLCIYREVLVRKKKTGANLVHTITRLDCTANMAGTLFYQNRRFKKALSLFKMALDVSIPSELLPVAAEESHWQEEPEIDYEISISSNDERDEEFIQRKMMLCRADTLHSMANVCSVLDDTYKAINFYHEALKIQSSLLGEDDPHVIMTLQNAATGYVRAGKYETALEIYRKVLKSSSQHGSIYHLEFDALVGIGLTQAKIGNSSQALIAYKEALQFPQKNYRLKEKQAAVHNEIGEIYKASFDIDWALYHFRRSLEMYMSIGFKRKHPQVKAVLLNIESLGVGSCCGTHGLPVSTMSKFCNCFNRFKFNGA